MNALPVVLESVGSEVAFPDVCAAEAIRMFAPEVWKELPAVAAQQGSQHFLTPDPLEDLAKKAGPHERPILSLLQLLLIPDARRAQARRRLAHPSVMRIYLERARPGTIAPADAVSQALSLAADPEAFANFIASFTQGESEDIFGRLEAFVDDVPPSWRPAFLASVFNELPRQREEARGMLDFGPEVQAARLAIRLLDPSTKLNAWPSSTLLFPRSGSSPVGGS